MLVPPSSPPTVPTGAPSVQVTPTSPTVLLVTWKKLPPEQAQGTIVGYKIHWRKPNHHYYHVNEVQKLRTLTLTHIHTCNKILVAFTNLRTCVVKWVKIALQT